MTDTSIIEDYYKNILQTIQSNLDEAQKIIKIADIFTKIRDERDLNITEWNQKKNNLLLSFIMWIIITLILLIAILFICYFRVKDMRKQDKKYNTFDYIITLTNIAVGYIIITGILSIFINNISLNLKYANGMIKMIESEFEKYMSLVLENDKNLTNILLKIGDDANKGIDTSKDIEENKSKIYSHLSNFNESKWESELVTSGDAINIFLKLEKIINKFENLVITEKLLYENLNIDEIISKELDIWKNNEDWVGGEAILWLNGFDGKVTKENLAYVYYKCKYVYNKRREDRLFTKDWWLSDVMLGKYIKEGTISMVLFDKWWLGVMMVVKENIKDIEEGIVNKIGSLLCKYKKTNSSINDPIVAKAVELKNKNQIKNCETEEGFDEFLEKWSKINDKSTLRINELYSILDKYYISVNSSLKSDNQRNILWQKNKDNLMFKYVMGIVLSSVILLLICIISSMVRYYTNNKKNKDYIIAIIIVFFLGILVIAIISAWINKKNAEHQHNNKIVKNNTQLLFENVKILKNATDPRIIYISMKNVVNNFKKYNYIIVGNNQEVPFPYTDVITYGIGIIFIIAILAYAYISLQPLDKLKKIRENIIKKELLASANIDDINTKFNSEINQEYNCEMQSFDESIWVVKISLLVLTILFIIITIVKVTTSSINYESGLRNSKYYKNGIAV